MTHDSIDPEAVFRRADDIVRRTIAGETLLVPIRGQLADMQRLFALNPVAEAIWRQMDGKRSLTGIRDDLVEQFDVSDATAEGDLTDFVRDLLAAGLIERA